MASWFVPSITSIRQPIRQMGELAVELLLKQLAGEAIPPATVLPVELMERETT
ncbi:Lactose operon repressor [compost metagenome]